jgi:hypothetical protein
MEQPSLRDCVRVAFLALLGPVLLSLIGPAYYGYSDGAAFRDAVFGGEAATLSFWFKAIIAIAIIVWATLGLVATDSLAYGGA